MIPSTRDYKARVYARSRSFKGRVTMTMNGTTSIYDNNIIMKMRVLEEISLLSESVPSNELELTMNNQLGDFDFLNLPNFNEIIANKPEIKVEVGLVTQEGEEQIIEWIPMGTYFLTDWKNDNTNKVITMTANDSFSLLSNVRFVRAGNSEPVLLTEMLQSLFTQANIHLSKIYIDPSLEGILVNDFKYPDGITDCRTALQMIGVASQTMIYQDRYGVINIKPSSSETAPLEYISYIGNQGGLFSYPGNQTYSLIGNYGGAIYLDFEQMYNAPQLTLIKSLYELVVNIYDSLGEVIEDFIYVKEDVQNNGISLKIENTLVHTEEMANAIADWYFDESINNVLYEVRWRGNPILEVGDIITIEDGFGAEKKSRIYRQEFIYEGYLEARTYTKGGF